MSNDKPSGLALLREPFAAEHISVKPRLSCKACQDSQDKSCSRHPRQKCDACGNWISTAHIHLSYVGHAALTNRLLDADPTWNWEPMAVDDRGAPLLDGNCGLWIRLTVCGLTRIGYGDAPGKRGGDAVKEAIGDALRNAAMRFGAALDLWHKGDLTPQEETEPAATPARRNSRPAKAAAQTPATPADKIRASIRELAGEMKWDLNDIATDFASDHDITLKACQDVEVLTEYLSRLEEVADGQRAERGEGSAA